MHLRIRYKQQHLEFLEKELIQFGVIITKDKNNFTSYSLVDNVDDTYVIDENNWDFIDEITKNKKGFQNTKKIIQFIHTINQTLKVEDRFVITFYISKLEYDKKYQNLDFDHYSNFTTEDFIRNLCENTINDSLPNHKELIIYFNK